MAPAKTKRAAAKKIQLSDFPLFTWFLAELGLADWKAARALLSDPAYEGRASDGSSKFSQVLIARAAAHKLSEAMLIGYDAAILGDWDYITRRRIEHWGTPRLKYFQYLCLLAVEHFLTRYRDDATSLLRDLNAHAGDDVFTPDDLRKMAVSIATGAGKTLLMHANYRQWIRLVGRDTVDAVILITPSELLSRHHLSEFALSGINAGLFDPDLVTLFDADTQVKIIDINKLREKKGAKTVAVESFGTRNLVLIDEAHRGSRSEDQVWKEYRDRLSRDGFAFEYSATFRQAVAAANNPALVAEYEKAIIFDYPYREFYNDGFGKDFRVRNGEFDDESDEAALYFVAALLMFFQQQIVFARDQEAAKQSAIDAPLLLAVGTTVQKDDSDVANVLSRLREFIERRGESIVRVKRLLDDPASLVATDGQPVVYADLDVLRDSFPNAESLYDALRHSLFHAGAGGSIRLARYTAAPGEIRVSVDASPPFALVNVGDASSLYAHLTQKLGFPGDEQGGAASDAMFDSVSKGGSVINVLIGARKFLEGWDSNRPSSMLLMNVGRGEGTQIIQLFGRGVRLRGFEGSLLRSSRDLTRPPVHKDLRLLESLEIFGVRADYIKTFRKHLEIEGITKTFDGIRSLKTNITIPAKPTLKVLRVEGPSYIETHPEVVFDAKADTLRVTLDWYPRVLAYASVSSNGEKVEREAVVLDSIGLSFIDLDRVYAAMLAYKRSRRWDNVVVPRKSIDDLFAKTDWYTLYASNEALRPAGLGTVRTWQAIAEALATSYLSEWYRVRLREHETERLKVGELNGDDPAIVNEYSVYFDVTDHRIEEVLDGAPRRTGDALEIIHVVESIYDPLLYVADRESCSTVPISLIKSERDFVGDVIRFVRTGGLKGTDVDLYLLRNASRGRGMGFAEADNFHPDFALWFVRDGNQVLMFVEPHGLAHEMLGFASPKIEFSKTIRRIETRLADPALKLAASIVSATPRVKVKWASDAKQSELDDYNVFFAEDNYIGSLMRKGLERLDEFSATIAP